MGSAFGFLPSARHFWRFYPEWPSYHTPWTLLVSAAAVASVLGLAMGRLAKLGQRALLAPIEIEAAAAMDTEEIWFSAVAVTPRTRAAVAVRVGDPWTSRAAGGARRAT